MGVGEEHLTKPQESLRGRLNVHLTFSTGLVLIFVSKCSMWILSCPASQFSLHNFRSTAFVHPVTRQD